jgi:hypothetical protein
MVKHNTGGDLVDVLTAGPGGTHKSFVDIPLPNT